MVVTVEYLCVCQIPNVIVFYCNIFVHIILSQLFAKLAHHNLYFNQAYYIKILSFTIYGDFGLKSRLSNTAVYLINASHRHDTILRTHWMPDMYTVYWHNNILLYHAYWYYILNHYSLNRIAVVNTRGYTRCNLTRTKRRYTLTKLLWLMSMAFSGNQISCVKRFFSSSVQCIICNISYAIYITPQVHKIVNTYQITNTIQYNIPILWYSMLSRGHTRRKRSLSRQRNNYNNKNN